VIGTERNDCAIPDVNYLGETAAEDAVQFTSSAHKLHGAPQLLVGMCGMYYVANAPNV